MRLAYLGECDPGITLTNTEIIKLKLFGFCVRIARFFDIISHSEGGCELRTSNLIDSVRSELANLSFNTLLILLIF